MPRHARPAWGARTSPPACAGSRRCSVSARRVAPADDPDDRVGTGDSSLPVLEALFPGGIGGVLPSLTPPPPVAAGTISSAQRPRPGASGEPIDPELAACDEQGVAACRRKACAGATRGGRWSCAGPGPTSTTSAEAWRCYGLAAQAVGAHQEALGTLRKARRYDPSDRSLDAAESAESSTISCSATGMTHARRRGVRSRWRESGSVMPAKSVPVEITIATGAPRAVPSGWPGRRRRRHRGHRNRDLERRRRQLREPRQRQRECRHRQQLDAGPTPRLPGAARGRRSRAEPRADRAAALRSARCSSTRKGIAGTCWCTPAGAPAGARQ